MEEVRIGTINEEEEVPQDLEDIISLTYICGGAYTPVDFLAEAGRKKMKAEVELSQE